jgi:hypothetical protein
VTRPQLEAAWRKAAAEHERRSTVANLRAEEQAWDRYTLACNDLGECQQPGCRILSPEWAYCELHRQN